MPDTGVPARARRRSATPWWEELDRDAFRFPTEYRVKPAPRAVAPPPPESNGSDYVGFRRNDAMKARVINLARDGMTLAKIMQTIGSNDYNAVHRWLRGAGVETNVDRAKRQLEEAILEAGEAGCAPAVLGRIAHEHDTRAGPYLLAMMKSKTVKRLANGNWVMR